MNIHTRATDFALTEGILRHVESRLESALGPFARNVLRVAVHVDDVNANRGGIDKRCSVVVALGPRGVVIAKATHEDLYVAVDEAAARIRRSVKRALTRQVGLQRKGPKRPYAMVTV